MFLKKLQKALVSATVFFLGSLSLTGFAQANPSLSAQVIEQSLPASHVTVHVKSRHSGSVLVNVYDGSRNIMPDKTPLLYRLIDGNNRDIFTGYINSGRVVFDHVPVRNNGADNFRVIVSRSKYDDGGISSVLVTAGTTQVVNLMEIPHKAVFDFSHAHWQDLQANYPDYWRVISSGASSQEQAAARWESLVDNYPNRAACILNLFTAMTQLQLPDGQTMLPYYKELIWDKTMAQDRFFAWVDPELENEIELGVQKGIFATEPGAGVLHPGATDAFKQIALDEADLNPTFHDNNREVIDGRVYVMFELDIDYYKDSVAHAFGEVIPNMISGHLTDPMKVYQLRFNSGSAAGLAEYQPPETIIEAGKRPNGRHSDARSYRNLRLLKFWRYMKKKPAANAKPQSY